MNLTLPLTLLGSLLLAFMPALAGCGSASKQTGADTADTGTQAAEVPQFSADSAYAYLKHQVEFGPRVPNTEAHRRAGDWLAAELRRHGAQVTEQRATLRAFDGTPLQARNILARFNPGQPDRILLLAHWDCRPWADEDTDPSNHRTPVDGANDGASGAAVLLETARLAKLTGTSKGIDLLLLDAEDWGTTHNDDSWALGAQHFMANLPDSGAYRPRAAVLLDMVGGRGATFCREWFSQQADPALADAIWATARQQGFADFFPNRMGGAVTDDHVKLIDGGIPAIDIIDYRPGQGFNPTWHTTADNLDNIDPATLRAVGQTLAAWLFQSEN